MTDELKFTWKYKGSIYEHMGADTALIAAAPDLYASLNALIAWYDKGVLANASDIRAARDALAKARGAA